MQTAADPTFFGEITWIPPLHGVRWGPARARLGLCLIVCTSRLQGVRIRSVQKLLLKLPPIASRPSEWIAVSTPPADGLGFVPDTHVATPFARASKAPMTTRNTRHMRCLKSLASLTLIASSSAFIAAAPAGKTDDGRALYNQLLREMGVPASTLTGHATDPYGGLITEGNQIVDQTGNYVRMTGANWSGFETANAAPAGVWTRDFKSCIDEMARLAYDSSAPNDWVLRPML